MGGSAPPLVTTRRKIVLGTLSAMLLGLAGLMVLRPRVAHEPAIAPASAPPLASSAPATPPSASAAAATSASAAPAVPKFELGRELRVSALGWDVAAPVIVANDGLEPGKASLFSASGIGVRIAVPSSASAVESALARGGDDRDGADVALMPLPDLVSGWERLGALSPRIFLVVGWSRGREALYTTRESLVGPASKKEAVLASPAHDSSAFLGLFVLDKAGIPSRLVTAMDGKAELTASDRMGTSTTPPPGRLLLTTADAPRLVPIVAVASAGLFEKHTPLLTEWSRKWFEGQARVQQDAAAAARKVSALPGAPEPLVLVRRLGEVSPASLWDNARAARLAGRSPVTLDRLFQECWMSWRSAGVLTTPQPDAPAVQPQVITALVRSSPSLAPPGAQEFKARTDDAAPLLVSRIGKGKVDDSVLESEVGFLAGVFERSVLRVGVVGRGSIDDARTRKLIQSVVERFELPAGRIVPSRAALTGKEAAIVEVLPVP